MKNEKAPRQGQLGKALASIAIVTPDPKDWLTDLAAIDLSVAAD